jgi:hypothetical protein
LFDVDRTRLGASTGDHIDTAATDDTAAHHRAPDDGDNRAAAAPDMGCRLRR